MHRVTMHNAFGGWASNTQYQMDKMLQADSLTPRARSLANQISAWAMELRNELKTRVDVE